MSEVRTYLGIFPYLGGLFVLLIVTRFLVDKQTSYDDNEQMGRGNIAAMLDRAGIYAGVALAVGGSLIGTGKNYWADFWSFLLDGVVAIAFFALARYPLDYVVLPRVNNSVQLEAGNKALGMVQMSTYLSLGAIMMASFSGGGTKGVGQSLLSSLLFSVLGLVALMVGYILFSKVLGGNLNGEIRRKNIDTALDVSSLLVGMGVALAFSIGGDFEGWAKDIRSFALAVPFVFVAIFLGLLASNLLVPNSLRGKFTNRAESVLSATMTVMAGLITGLVIL